METVYSINRPKFGIMKQAFSIKCLILYTKSFQSKLRMYYFSVFFFRSANETIFSTTSYKESVQPLVICMMAFYLLVANVLLLNILIAVFKYVMLSPRYMLAEMTFLKKGFSRGFVQYYIKLLLNLQKQSLSSKPAKTVTFFQTFQTFRVGKFA